MSTLPALEPLAAVAERLGAAGIPYTLGGSALLHAIGLADRVGDWDLTTDAAVDDVERALHDLAPTRHGHSGVHADHKLVCFGGTVEVIEAKPVEQPKSEKKLKPKPEAKPAEEAPKP